MNSKRIQFLLTGVTAFISLMFFITPTCGTSIIIGGNYTDIGTITFVSPKPGDTSAMAGTALLNTISGITDNSATNPYLIKLSPGVYDIGTSSLQMKQYVDVEGSGENTTIITGQIDASFAGVVQGANNAEIRFLTVMNTGGGISARALYCNGLGPSAKITNVTASASGATIGAGVTNNSSSPTMTNVTASATGATNSNYGIVNWSSSSPVMANVAASASGGAFKNNAIYNENSSPTMMNMTASASGGTHNFGVQNQSSSPMMMNVTTSASDGQFNTGVENFSSSPTMLNVRATASGADVNWGVFNESSSSPTMTNGTASASNGQSNTGVYNKNSSPTMTNVSVSGSGGTNNYGVYSDTSSTIMINNSVIIGSLNTIYNDINTTTRVGNTKLDGGPVSNAGTLTCVGAYNGSYVALGVNCQ